MKATLVFVCIAAALATLAGFNGWLPTGRATSDGMAIVTTTQAEGAVPETAPATARSEPSLDQRKTIATVRKNAQVRALIAAGTPSAAMEAYRMIRHCLNARSVEIRYKQHPNDFQIRPDSPQAACDDIDAGQISSRLIYLRQAANAGTRDAATMFATEMAELDEDTPADQRADWSAEARRYVEIGAANGDPMSLMALAYRYENEPESRDLKKSWAYWLAANEVRIQETGKPLPMMEKIRAEFWQQLSLEDRFTSEQLAAKLVASFGRQKR